MLKRSQRTASLFRRLSSRIDRLTFLHLVRRVILSALTVQVLTAAVLLGIAAFGRRRKHDASFPHRHYEEVWVGENSLQLYSYGHDLYDAMLEAIDGARESIYLETYIWKDDDVGREFQACLARKAAEGVAVYVIFDRFGNLVVPRSFKSSFAPQVHALEYSALDRPWHLFDLRRFALDHRKLLVVDGTTGFIGGYNIGSLYATQWRDTHLGLRGPVVAGLARSFIAFWNRFCPTHERIEANYHAPVDSRITLSQNEAMRLSFPIRNLHIAAIDRAEQFILLTTAYFVPDQMLCDALKAAAGRGVDVHVLVPWVSNHVLADWISHSYFTDLLRGSVRIFGYRYTMLHAKTCTIDGQWSTVGTSSVLIA